MKKFFDDFQSQFFNWLNLVLLVVFSLVAWLFAAPSADVPQHALTVAGWAMFTQPLVIWSLVLRRPETVSAVSIFGFLVLQSSGALRTYDAQAAWLLASMLVALLGSVALAVRPFASWLAGWSLCYKGLLWLGLITLYASCGYLLPLLFGVLVPVWLLQAAGILMVFQVFAIWGFTYQAWKTVGRYEGLSYWQISIFTTLQASGSVLALQADDEWIFAAMSMSLIGTLTTGGIKLHRQWTAPQPSYSPAE